MGEMVPRSGLGCWLGGRALVWVQLAPGDAGGALGRLAVLRARLGLAGEPQAQHVHPDRDGDRHGLSSSASSRRSPPASFRIRSATPRQGRSPVYFEPAAVITTLVLLGQVLELRARRQTGSAIRALLGLAPKTARRLARRDARRTSPIDQVVPGDRLRIRPGEKVPVDGVVIEGIERRRRVDDHAASRSRSRRRRATAMIGGTVNGTGGLVMRAERVGAETMLAQIVRMVGEARRTRAPIQRLADQVSAYFVPGVILVAIITFVRLGRLRPRAAPGARAGQRRRGPDHRLPVRPRAGDADVDHGRHRAGGRPRACWSRTPRRSRSSSGSTPWSSTRPARSPRASRGSSRS